MLYRYFAAILAVALTILAACNGGGDSTTNQTSVSSMDPFPLSIGNQWQYDFTDRVTTKRIVDVKGTRVVDGFNATVLEVNNAEYALYYRTESAVTQLPADNASAYTRAVGPRIILKLPVRPGDRWVQVDKFTTVENKVISELTEVLVNNPEDVITPAGYFKGAYPVVTSSKIMTTDIGSTTSVTTLETKIEWIVLGLGVVRREINTVSPSSFERQTSERLTSYSIVKS